MLYSTCITEGLGSLLLPTISFAPPIVLRMVRFKLSHSQLIKEADITPHSPLKGSVGLDTQHELVSTIINRTLSRACLK